MIKLCEICNEKFESYSITRIYCYNCSGHQHWTKQIQEDEKNYYIVGSLTDNVDMLGIPDGVYLEVEIQDRNIKVQEKHIKVENEKNHNSQYFY